MKIFYNDQARWIPCNEKLPKYKAMVIVSVNKAYEEDGWFGIGIAEYRYQKWWKDGTIAAWMPLPEPYKEGNE